MNRTVSYTPLLLITLALFGILATVFMADASMANYKRRFIFQWADLLILLFAGIVCLTYDWELNPEPDKLLFGGQNHALICLFYIFAPEFICPWINVRKKQSEETNIKVRKWRTKIKKKTKSKKQRTGKCLGFCQK
jgi:hypothetical protein